MISSWLLVILTIITAYLQVWSKIPLFGLPQCVLDKVIDLQVENFNVSDIISCPHVRSLTHIYLLTGEYVSYLLSYVLSILRRRNFKTQLIYMVRSTIHTVIENGVFRKRWLLEIFVICVLEFSSNTNPKWPMMIVASSNSSGVVWTEIIYYAFTVRTLFSNFPGVVWTKP